MMEQRAEVVGRYWVSTLRMLFEHADLLYETAVFEWDEDAGEVASEEPLWLERWPGPQEAEAGHERVCEALRSGALSV
jgi:hypothetical protein